MSTNNTQVPSRQEAILLALAGLLETDPGSKITTANLARAVGVTEAALYRHFPSKRKMFEGLIDFAEEAVFSRCQQILNEQGDARVRLSQLTSLMLVFADRNPGLCRVLTGEALTGEDDVLRRRASQFFERLETQLRQVIKEGEIRQGLRVGTSSTRAAAWLMVFVEGRIQRFVRSTFKHRPAQDFDESWALLTATLWSDQPG
ncbi:nucleoid occlusion factor SlmA [Marinobacter sp. X15-166B]|uniref:nucleoid occlusion factor SlmA n=1 Tax=Marinobacter sp. X15-166B TaxID=1897620 RepID=UPI00085BEA48|nr:nucleoid occlusion factor SlmA [Marinobacter sp. X15-166B]OEY65712.1 nucleoid occlusion factor SlmA [Marinobacter sp. X15-166B]